MNQQNTDKPQLLIHCLARYIGYMGNDPEVVPAYINNKAKSPEYIKDTQRGFKELLLCLKKSDKDINKLRLDQLDSSAVKEFHEYLEETKPGKDRTYDLYFGALKQMMNYYINEEGYDIKNIFKVVKKKSANTHRENTIPLNDYQALLEIVQQPEKGIQILSSGAKKQLYRPWLKDAIELGMLTGRRREEIIRIKFSDIIEEDNVIKIEDYKVNRMKNLQGNAKKYLYSPIIPPLADLMKRLGREKHRGVNRFLIDHNGSMSRKTMVSFLTKAFTHYHRKLGTDRDASFKCLRKTFATELSKEIGIEGAQHILGHFKIDTLKGHYVSARELAKSVQGFDMFGGKLSGKVSRSDELDQARAMKNKQLRIER